MLHEGRPIPLSPSKGKAREGTRWRMGWWDFMPLVEHAQTPLVWSEASIIFTAHPMRLDITGRHFSSSRQFLISPPAPVNASAAQFEPPSFISVAPGDRYLFAFYPGKNGDGLGCIWRRGPRLDSWLFVDYWKFTKFTYPLTVEWLGAPRKWHVDEAGSATRLPSRGPKTPVSSPSLFLVTSDHRANLCYLRHYYSLRVISCPLDQNSATSEMSQPDDYIPKRVAKKCIAASVGLAYNESSIIVATRVHYQPSQFSPDSQFDTTIDVPVDNAETNFDAKASEWELWGEEEVIHLCELRLQFDGVLMSLHAIPLRPIRCSAPGLVRLIVVPSAQNYANAPSTATSSNVMGNPVFHIVAACLDFGDYTSTPKSEIVIYTLAKLGSNPGQPSDPMSWTVRQETSRSFHSEVVCFVAPFFTESKSLLCHIGIMKTSGSIPRKGKVEIGYIKVLKLIDLHDDESWKTSSIMSATDKSSYELPLTVAISQNDVLITTVSTRFRHASVHTLPTRRQLESDSIPRHSVALASAVLLGKSTSDITHVLSSSAVATNEIVNILQHLARSLDDQENGLRYRYTATFIGVVIETYKARVKQPSSEDERGSLELRTQTLFDILSIKALNEAFDSCSDDDGNADLPSIWHLIGLSEFIIHFVENLVKECILWCNPINGDAQASLDTPTLLPLAHPYTLENVRKAVGHVAKLRAYVGSLPAGGEKENTAKNVLLDLVDYSGIDFSALETLLIDCSKEPTDHNEEDHRRSLALCQPMPSMYPRLGTILRKIGASAAVNKPMLFIKPTDLIDGVQQLSLGHEKREPEIDVILKKPLAKQAPDSVCLRCGGGSLLGADLFKSDVSIKWRMWEKMQMPRCVCYGFIMKANQVTQI